MIEINLVSAQKFLAENGLIQFLLLFLLLALLIAFASCSFTSKVDAGDGDKDKLLVMPDYTMNQFLLIYNMTF